MKNDNSAIRYDRTSLRQPRITVPQNITLPPIVKVVARSGVEINVIDAPSADVVRFSFVFAAGSVRQQKSFEASATVNMLSEGSTSLTSQQIAEQLDYYGSYFDVSLDRDFAIVTFCCLGKFFDPTMELAREILLRPAFDQTELDIYCHKNAERLAVERTKAAFRARELFARTLFGPEHPYGVSYPQSAYFDLSSDDLRRFYERFYTAANSFAVMSGMTTPERIDAVCELAAALPAGSASLQMTMPPIQSMPFAVDVQEDAVQSAIRIGRPMFTRSHPDWIGMQVLSTILGGYFGSRLILKLREEKGYTYGIYSAMINLDCSGYLAIATEVAAEASVDAINEIFAQIELLRREAVTRRELDTVRNIMVGEMMRILDGPFGIADVAIENIQNHQEGDYIGRMVEEIGVITPRRLQQLAKEYFARENFSLTAIANPTVAELLRSNFSTLS